MKKAIRVLLNTFGLAMDIRELWKPGVGVAVWAYLQAEWGTSLQLPPSVKWLGPLALILLVTALVGHMWDAVFWKARLARDIRNAANEGEEIVARPIVASEWPSLKQRHSIWTQRATAMADRAAQACPNEADEVVRLGSYSLLADGIHEAHRHLRGQTAKRIEKMRALAECLDRV